MKKDKIKLFPIFLKEYEKSQVFFFSLVNGGLFNSYHIYFLQILQLFHFDVHEDVRTIADATIEKDEV